MIERKKDPGGIGGVGGMRKKASIFKDLRVGEFPGVTMGDSMCTGDKYTCQRRSVVDTACHPCDTSCALTACLKLLQLPKNSLAAVRAHPYSCTHMMQLMP